MRGIPKLKLPKLNKRQKRFMIASAIAFAIVISGVYLSQLPPVRSEGYLAGINDSWVTTERFNIKAILILNGITVDTIPLPAVYAGVQWSSFFFNKGENVTVVVTNHNSEPGDPVVSGTGFVVVSGIENSVRFIFNDNAQWGYIFFRWIWSDV